ncbi:RICIN domain-containing protein [Streptomyces sp. ISL-44]|uniref:GH12 family glycosyl hydrolase domain-containing protein n=1 Tax=Streptomyces sp. ISL-44 TaxID=2819184 RepID=UPI001BE9020B|nr:ricin-type beta-trefoil lectin domain protein [Streptomyces sp. ISL-44]MBT2541556.1 RICIN domain-containing protein [Streptomyces sp. ISL-44]
MRLRSIVRLAAALVVACAALVLPATPAAAGQWLCDQYGSLPIGGGQYIVMNNRYGTDAKQCVEVNDNGFEVVEEGNNVPTTGSPASYPAIYAGCHYGNCTTGSGMPVKASAIGDARSTAGYHTVDEGTWNASYDIWFDTNAGPAGQNDGTEIMIWGSKRGTSQPAGAKVDTVWLAGATWDVWKGRLTNNGISWNVVSYVRQQVTNWLDISIKEFSSDSVTRGYLDNNWYMTSVQFGFEPWIGGKGLGVDSFTYTPATSGGGIKTITGRGSNRCLDVAYGDTRNESPVQIFDCHGDWASQQWRRSGETFVNVNSGKCLDIRWGATGNGSPVQIYDCNGTGAQKWTVNANGTIVNPTSGRCLDVSGQATWNGARVQIYDCDTTYSQLNQLWTVS